MILRTVATLATLWLAQTLTANSGVDPRLQTFAAIKRKQIESFAESLRVTIAPEVRGFFSAAEKGDLVAVTNEWARIWPRSSHFQNSSLDPSLGNILWIPIHETYYAYEQFNSWDLVLLQKYASRLLGALPANCIYFAGTDPGRFVITAIRDAADTPDICIVTQNGLADYRYLEYVRRVYGSRISVPTDVDTQQAFAKYAEEIRSRTAEPGEEVRIEGGRVTVQGTVSVMKINSMLTKMIFDNNKGKHSFYIEESYVIPWMFPYLEPYGLILKLNGEPQAELSSDVVMRDRKFWDALLVELLADTRFKQNNTARFTFARLRSSIAGVYAYRKMMTHAEYAYRQSLALMPASPEANFRFAQLYVDFGRLDDAIKVMEEYYEKYEPVHPGSDGRPAIQSAIASLRKLKQQNSEKATR